MNNEKITINDVAKKAGVSKTTVSRYLNGKFEYMSIETKTKIEKVIDEYDYRPSNIARSLKASSSGVIGCVIADITSPFSSYIVKGINDVFKKYGYQVLFVNTDNKAGVEIEGIQSLLDHRVDGIIVNTTGCNDEYLIELQKQGLPIVLADRCIKKRGLFDTVTSNNYNATFRCMEYLHEQGYKKVAFFTENMGSISSRYLRHTAYLDAMAKIYNIDGNDYTFYIDAKDISTCEACIKKFVDASEGEPIAIFTVNGVSLLGVLQSMQKANYKIFEDIGICGFDDWGWASLITPGITTITQQSFEIGIKSSQLLLKRIKEGIPEEKEYIEMETELMKRGSTNLVAKEG
ncbi:MAG: LacI family DNA-binding transcriptional regulator [Breznakia sp.]